MKLYTRDAPFGLTQVNTITTQHKADNRAAAGTSSESSWTYGPAKSFLEVSSFSLCKRLLVVFVFVYSAVKRQRLSGRLFRLAASRRSRVANVERLRKWPFSFRHGG